MLSLLAINLFLRPWGGVVIRVPTLYPIQTLPALAGGARQGTAVSSCSPAPVASTGLSLDSVSPPKLGQEVLTSGDEGGEGLRADGEDSSSMV